MLKPIDEDHTSGSGDDDVWGNYTGCLDMTEDELEAAWQFPGDMPDCTGGISDSSSYGGSGYGDQGDDATFDLTNCASYSNVWLWDLALTCDDDTTLDGCYCAFAERLFNEGSIQCATSDSRNIPYCPDSCSVCQTCMVLLGCEDIYNTEMSVAKAYLPYMIASAIGLGVTGLILYFTTSRRRKRKRISAVDNKLPAHLMEMEAPVQMVNVQPQVNRDNNVWLAPVYT